ncbi:MFS general substrate transporter [Coprinopsis marcescibilis]|uniref:MFS general substrate transporter n=1 Tax=Coprinopsis marcescibilis TaxID=230819 RepID=A0A5C3KNH8_COPMA|nr:MFS general substrate transporter [Coprinopsis marcescibilis]
MEKADFLIDSPHASFSKTLGDIDSKKLWRKVDLKLLPILTIMYLFSFMDRGSHLGNARLQGLESELNMTGSQYNLALPYCLFEVPSNLILKKFRPSRWLPFLTVTWGIAVGFVKNFTQLLALRILLGAAEAGFYPGVVYYLSLWYPRHMYQTRLAYFFGAASMAGAFSGLLAYAIGFMDGVQGMRGWSWIFIVEGGLTVIVGLLAFVAMVDLPGTAVFLTDEERLFVLDSHKMDASPLGEEEHFEKRHVWSVICDWQVLYGITFFSPFGYSPAITQLLSVPPYVVATIAVNVTSYYSDKHQMRSPFILLSLLLGLIGYAINFSNASIGAKYFGIFLCVTGSYAGVPGVSAWQGSNLPGHYRRGVGLAMNIAGGNLGGLIAPMVFRNQDSPRFLLGFGVQLGIISVSIVTCCFAIGSYKRVNATRDRAEARLSEGGLVVDEVVLLERRRLGDKAVSFRYST